MYLDMTAIRELILLLSSLEAEALGVLRLEYDSGSAVACGIGPRSDFPVIKKFICRFKKITIDIGCCLPAASFSKSESLLVERLDKYIE